MVQMKAGKQNQPDDFLDAFISHMVQMKVEEKEIYLILIYAFISHMVQMKVLHLGVVQAKCLTLYPTWFR